MRMEVDPPPNPALALFLPLQRPSLRHVCGHAAWKSITPLPPCHSWRTCLYTLELSRLGPLGKGFLGPEHVKAGLEEPSVPWALAVERVMARRQPCGPEAVLLKHTCV